MASLGGPRDNNRMHSLTFCINHLYFKSLEAGRIRSRPFGTAKGMLARWLDFPTPYKHTVADVAHGHQCSHELTCL
jgi:hypothetical protein